MENLEKALKDVGENVVSEIKRLAIKRDDFKASGDLEKSISSSSGWPKGILIESNVSLSFSKKYSLVPHAFKYDSEINSWES